MTRINTIEPELLTDQHLIAEWRELPRVFALARPAPDAPKAYTLGTGHVRFFFERTGYLSRRQAALIAECLSRGFAIRYTTAPAPVPGLDGDWEPDALAIEVNRERLREKLRTAKRPYTHRGVQVGEGFYG